MKLPPTLPPVRVFAHHSECYRWRTLIQVGDDWTIRGSVWMKNPGSSRPIAEPISMFDIEELRSIDDSADWFCFTVDPTMRAIVNLFRERARNNSEVFSGIIQIFNVINVMSPDVEEALTLFEKSTNPLKTTVVSDLKNTVSPVYIGWGNFHKLPAVADIANDVLQDITTRHDIDYQVANGFIHPLYLMVYGSNKSECRQVRTAFCKSAKI